MEESNERVIHVLEKLIETCRNGQNGFRDAAEHTKNTQLKQYFNQESLVRAQFAGDLENEVIHLGDHDPERKGTIGGTLHRAWFDLKEKFTGSDATVLDSVEAGEDVAKHEYQEALSEEQHLPTNIYSIVRQQATHIFNAHDKVRELRDQHKKAA